MKLRGLEEFGKESTAGAKIAQLIVDRYGGDLAEANKLWKDVVAECLWTREIWGDRNKAEWAAASLILHTIYTDEELKAKGVALR
jgi:hypothetical protein